MEEHDQYESVGLDDSLEDERNLDEIIADRRAAEAELDTRDISTGAAADRKLPQMLDDLGTGFNNSSRFWRMLQQISKLSILICALDLDKLVFEIRY